MTVHNVTTWDADQLAPYMTDILLCLGKLGRRFPQDCNTSALFKQYLDGSKALWIALDDAGKVALVFMSHVRTVEATGTKLATLCDMAGEHVERHADAICKAVEEWAEQNGCDVWQVEGRKGWERILKRHGYAVHSVLYRKTR